MVLAAIQLTGFEVPIYHIHILGILPFRLPQ